MAGYDIPALSAPGVIVQKEEMRDQILLPTKGRIGNLPSALAPNDTEAGAGVDLAAFEGLHLRVGSGGAEAGGAVDMQGADLGGYNAAPIRLSGNLTIDATIEGALSRERWKTYAGRVIELVDGTRQTITIDAVVPVGFSCLVLCEGAGGFQFALSGGLDPRGAAAGDLTKAEQNASLTLYRGTSGLWVMGGLSS
ncbi:hypothetical protein GC209_19265 [bacterium]|nr:hypothetical protein [bacterium]